MIVIQVRLEIHKSLKSDIDRTNRKSRGHMLFSNLFALPYLSVSKDRGGGGGILCSPENLGVKLGRNSNSFGNDLLWNIFSYIQKDLWNLDAWNPRK